WIRARRSWLASVVSKDVFTRLRKLRQAVQRHARCFNFRKAAVSLNDIRIHELDHAARPSEDFRRRGRFSGAIGSGDDEKVWHARVMSARAARRPGVDIFLFDQASKDSACSRNKKRVY